MDYSVDEHVTSSRLGVLVVCVLGLASGCRSRHGEMFGREPAIPPDFSFAMTTSGAVDSPLALEFHTDRMGRATWRTWNRTTGVETDHAEAEITEEQVESIWFAAVDAKLGRTDAGSPPDDSVAGSPSAIQRFALTARGVERVVWRPPGAADVEPFRKAVLELVPRDVATQFSGGTPPADAR